MPSLGDGAATQRPEMTTTDTTVDLASHPMTAWSGPVGLPDFARIEDADFGPVLDAALAAHTAEIDAIARNPEPPTIENTLAALELSGRPLDHAASILWLRAGAHTNDAIRALEREMAAKMARHFSAITMNAALFARIDALHARRDGLGLDAETLRVLERTWKRFVRSGAKLGEADKARLAAINEELAGLGARFGQNVLADESAWVVFLGDDDLVGLPDFLLGAMAEAAETRGRPGGHAVTLSRSLAEPFLVFSARRDLREKVFRGFVSRGENGGETDNSDIVAETLRLRAEKARLLGYDSYAALKLDDTMAKTPQAVMQLLEPVWARARDKAAEDAAELRRLASGEGHNDDVAPWDWRHYAEKLRAERFAFDEAELKPYLQLDRVIAAAFDVAGRLFGLRFSERAGVATWHPDVRVFEVSDADGSPCGTFLADYFNRPSKRSGAWMSSLEVGAPAG